MCADPNSAEATTGSYEEEEGRLLPSPVPPSTMSLLLLCCVAARPRIKLPLCEGQSADVATMPAARKMHAVYPIRPLQALAGAQFFAKGHRSARAEEEIDCDDP